MSNTQLYPSVEEEIIVDEKSLFRNKEEEQIFHDIEIKRKSMIESEKLQILDKLRKIDEEEKKNEEKTEIRTVNLRYMALQSYNQEFTSISSNIYNIIILGQSGVGKTTFYEQMNNPMREIDSDPKFYSQTSEPKFNTHVISKDNILTSITFIDTPGFFEVKSTNDEVKSRTDKQIAELINRCVKKEITNIHKILFVISYNTKFNSKNLDAIKTAFNRLPNECQKVSALLVTNCENTSQKQREKFYEQLKNYPGFDEVASIFEEKFETGCITNNNTQLGNEIFQKRYETLAEFRNKFLNVIFQEIKDQKKGVIIGPDLIENSSCSLQ